MYCSSSRTLRRFCALFLAFTLTCTLFCLPAAANEGFVIEDGVLTSYKGPGGDVTIPSGVTAIGEKAFYQCADLTGVTIPSGVTSIGDYAFDNCKALTSLTLPGSLTSIGVQAFSSCESLASVTIPEGVTEIGNSAFSYCTSLTGLTLPDSVTSLGSYVFTGCTGLTDVTLPGSLTALTMSMFLSCESLTSVTIPSSVTAIGDYAFCGCTGLTDVTIPNSVTSIGEYAFDSCESLTGISIPNSVTYIAPCAFSYCTSLTSVVIPSSVTAINLRTFGGCTSLASATIPSSVTEVSPWAFEDCHNLTICGDAGTAAETYAVEKNIPFVANRPAATPTAYARTQVILVDGQGVTFQAYALKDEKGNEANYVKLRDLAHVLNGTAAQFNVGWDGAVTLQTKTAYSPNGSELSTPYSGDQPYAPNSAAVTIDGAAVNLESFVITHAGGGYTYFKLRDLGQALGFNVSWDGAAGRAVIETNKPYTGV